MGTKISLRVWDGGSGWNDKTLLIGYCKESPEEVLRSIILTHDIHYYKNLYRPIDERYPNNVSGLVIESAIESELQGDMKGVVLSIIGSLSDLDLSRSITKLTRDKETFKSALKQATRWHLNTMTENDREYYDKVHSQIEEVGRIMLKTIT